MSKFLISCGGTGGHLAPGIAVGEALIARGHQAVFIISQKDVDSRLVEKYTHLKFYRAPGCAFSLNPIRLAKFALAQIKAVRFGLHLFKTENADATIAFGGFNSMGLAIAACILKKPIILHEANRKPGKAIRLLGGIADRVYIPAGVKISRSKAGIVRTAGYPIRREIKRLDAEESKNVFGFPKDANLLLVCGGSQGAAVLNDWALADFPKLAQNGIDVLCISGPGKVARKNMELPDANGRPRLFKTLEFCDNMAAAMSAAKVVVARAGAGSIAEFARCKTVPILVPYPSSADNHQAENALYTERNGAGICVLQTKIATLTDEVLSLIENDGLLEKMRGNLERLDEMGNLEKMVDDLEHVLKEAQGGE